MPSAVFVATPGIGLLGDALIDAVTNACSTNHPEIMEAMQAAAAIHLEELRGFYTQASMNPGNPWDILSDRRVIKRESQRPDQGDRPILIWSGRLLASLTPGSPGYYEGWGENSHQYGTSIGYAEVQNDGSLRIPPRPFMFMPTPMTLDEMANILFGGVAEVLNTETRTTTFTDDDFPASLFDLSDRPF